MVVVDEASTNHEVKLISKMSRELVGIATRILLQTLVTALVGCDLKHALADVESNDLLEAESTQFTSNKSSSAAEIENADVGRIFSFGHLLDHVGYLLRIRPASTVVQAFIIASYVVEVSLCVSIFVFVATLHELDVIVAKSIDGPVEIRCWVTVLIKSRSTRIYSDSTRLRFAIHTYLRQMLRQILNYKSRNYLPR